MPYQVCSTPASVLEAIPYLRSASPLLVDLEAMDLGRQYGALSVLSVGTTAARKIFIFDVLFLGREALQPVLDLLTSTRTLKIVWDGRMDDVELRRTFGISFGRILDLQIADVVSRSKRGAEDHLNMQVPGHPLYPVRHLDTEGVHALTALKKVLSAHGVPNNNLDASPAVINHTEWMTRPLPAKYLEYAAKDIELIAEVYALFLKRGYISKERDRAAIEKQSLRYVRMHTGPLPLQDKFRSSNLLPLEILTAPPVNESAMKECRRCSRRLGRQSFTYFLGSKSGARLVKIHDICKVCYLLGQRASPNSNRQRKAKPKIKRFPQANTPALQVVRGKNQSLSASSERLRFGTTTSFLVTVDSEDEDEGIDAYPDALDDDFVNYYLVVTA